MAILDRFTVICEATAGFGTTAAGEVKIGTAFPIGTARDIGNGHPIYLVIQVDTAFVGVGGSVNFKVKSSSAADLGTTPTTHFETGATAVTALTAGKRWVFELPLGVDYQNYVGITATSTGANTTAGKIDAYITPDKTGWKAVREAVS
jgi:hypothetical protein